MTRRKENLLIPVERSSNEFESSVAGRFILFQLNEQNFQQKIFGLDLLVLFYLSGSDGSREKHRKNGLNFRS